MKFNQQKLFQLHNIIKIINAVDLGPYSLPERFGIFDESGAAVAIMIWDGNKYQLDLINENLEEDHREEVERTEEVKEK